MVQVDVRGERIGRRVPVQVPMLGTVRDTVDALLPQLAPKSDSAHLDRMIAHYRRARARIDHLAVPGHRGSPYTRSLLPPPSTGSLPLTPCSPPMWARRAYGRPVICG